ncbi:hypothetical protein [Psychrobacter sp. W2-37-MNA-CIBAN-0211]
MEGEALNTEPVRSSIAWHLELDD